jgi:hypothetical protein
MNTGWLKKLTNIQCGMKGGYILRSTLSSKATGVPTTDFSGGEQTNGVFRQFGFELEKK